jgi:hypothetical protein
MHGSVRDYALAAQMPTGGPPTSSFTDLLLHQVGLLYLLLN